MIGDLSLAEASRAIADRKLSPVELAGFCLEVIGELDPAINAFHLVSGEQAMRAARTAEQEIARGLSRGPLHGIPIAVKDLLDTEGDVTTAGSRAWGDRPAVRDAHSVRRLREAGAVIIGKTTSHEFAYGSLTPQTRNPWDIDRVPGGSSGGSAAAVASAACYVGIGTDTAGSIRMPAALCGTVGIKPTYGLVSKQGVVPLSWSLDHVGPLTLRVEDAALALQAMVGHDPDDVGSARSRPQDLTVGLRNGVNGLTLGVPSSYFFDHLEPDVHAAVTAALEVLNEAGAVLREVDLPLTETYMGTTFTILLAEASAYHRDNLAARSERYTEDVRALLDAGMSISAVDYLQALRARRAIQAGWSRLFDEVDALVGPSLPTTAARVGQDEFAYPDGHTESIMSAYVRLSCPANLTGLPAMSVPCGFSRDSLPIGLQIIGRPFDESTVLRIGHTYESAMSWTTRRPPTGPRAGDVDA